MFERRWSEGWAKSKPNGFDKIKHFKTFQNKTNHFRPLEITELDSTLKMYYFCPVNCTENLVMCESFNNFTFR